MTEVEVKMGEVVVDKGRDILTASGVGSCVVIALYDAQLRIGAMAHAMLPSRNERGRSSKKGRRDTRYVDAAIDEMLKKLEARGAKRKDIEAKIAGGANMFSGVDSDIGSDNVLRAKEKLKSEGIRIVGECVGGSQGRSAEFSTASGIVTVKTKF